MKYHYVCEFRAGDIDTEEDGVFRVELPEEFSKFEAHLSQPVRMHNIRKRMQRENFQASNNSQDPINEYARYVLPFTYKSIILSKPFPSLNLSIYLLTYMRVFGFGQKTPPSRDGL